MATQGRKFLITINNPEEKGYDSLQVCIYKAISLKPLLYSCVSKEIGNKEHTPHIHAFLYYKNPKSWETIRNTFKGADVETCRGSALQNRDYVFKEGKWKDSEKGTTVIEGAQLEFGTLPSEKHSGVDPEMEILYELIKDGKTDAEIIEEHPEYIRHLSSMQRCRLIITQESHKNEWRNLEVTYIFGTTGTGKTRGVMEKYGYSNVFRVTDYQHPFDTYEGQDVLLLEEFASSLRIQDLLNYLDGYPVKLPARYSDKQACYTKVYITTNIHLSEQYPNVREENRETWNAFIRRIDKVIWYKSATNIIHYQSTDDYFHRDPRTGLPLMHLDF